MNIPTHMRRLKGFRYPRGIIAFAVWAYHRFALSTADVEDLLAAPQVVYGVRLPDAVLCKALHHG